MNNISIFALHAVIAVFVIIPMFLVLLALKFLSVTFYFIKHHVFQMEQAQPRIAQ